MAMMTVNTQLALLAGFFAVGGAAHFIFPTAYVAIMPPWLPQPILLVYISGVLEIAGGIAVLSPRLRTAAGWGLIALSLAVLPANVQMLLDAHRDHSSRFWQGLLMLRLPLQFALIAWIRMLTRPRRAAVPVPSIE
jgi:uncharacterized membrane protein